MCEVFIFPTPFRVSPDCAQNRGFFLREVITMSNEIMIAILSFAGTCIGSFSGMKLVTYRIEQLEKKVEKHNNFAERIPILEEKIAVANHRIEDLERKEG